MSLLKTKIDTKVWVEFGEISSAEPQEVRTWESKAGEGESYLGPRRSRHGGDGGGECLPEVRIGHNQSAQQEGGQGICIRGILSGKPILSLQGSSILTMAVVRPPWQSRVFSIPPCSDAVMTQQSGTVFCVSCSSTRPSVGVFARNGSSNCRRLEPLHLLS